MSNLDIIPISSSVKLANTFITESSDIIFGDGMESLTTSKEYQEGVKKVGPGSVFYYSSIFDPLPSDEFKDPKLVLSDKLAAYLESEFKKGLESAEKEGWISEEEMRAKYR